MSEIMTVRGPITPDDLGFTSMHEHVLFDARLFRRRFEPLPENPALPSDEEVRLDNLGRLKHGFHQIWDALIMEDVELMAEEMADFKAEGGSAVVDMSTPGMRVDSLKTRRVSEKSGVHIVTTTGLYARDSWPDRFQKMTSSDMEEYMLREIETGIENTDVKPGHIKIAVEEDFSEPELHALRAGARVAGRTGFSMTIHKGIFLESEAGLRIADILAEEEMDPTRVVLAHNRLVEGNLQQLIKHPEQWGLKLDIAKRLLDLGYNLSLDTFGHYWDAESAGFCAVADWQRLAGLYALIGDGYTDQLVLGTDTFIKILLRRFGGDGYCRLTSFVVPTLESVDVSAEDIHRLTVANPARILAC